MFPVLVYPDVPGKPSVTNIKSRSAVVTWRSADDYLDSRLKRYVIRVVNDNQTIILNVTSGIEGKKLTFNFTNLTEYTFYGIRVAAESEVAKSNLTEEMTFLTLCKLKFCLFPSVENIIEHRYHRFARTVTE